MIRVHRLYNQGIAPSRAHTPRKVVAALGAVQAQDYRWALWAVGVRLPGATEHDIEAAVTAKQLVRTWPMRGTLHFVAPEDARWMLALLAPRAIAQAAGRARQLELDGESFARSQQIFVEALDGDRQRTRTELYAELDAAGITTTGQRGYHLLVRAAQEGLICGGAPRGGEPTFALLDDWAPPQASLARDEALARLAERYFTGHGPATVHDLAWWSGLTISEARRAAAASADRLERVTVDGVDYRTARDVEPPPLPSPTVHLLPAFDEYLLGYARRDDVLDPRFAERIAPGRNGVFRPLLVIDGEIRGTWRRTLKEKRMVIFVEPFTKLNNAECEAIFPAAERYGWFVGAETVGMQVVDVATEP